MRRSHQSSAMELCISLLLRLLATKPRYSFKPMQKSPKCVSCQETNLFWVWDIYEHKEEDIELKSTVVQSYYGSTNKRKRTEAKICLPEN